MNTITHNDASASNTIDIASHNMKSKRGVSNAALASKKSISLVLLMLISLLSPILTTPVVSAHEGLNETIWPKQGSEDTGWYFLNATGANPAFTNIPTDGTHMLIICGDNYSSKQPTIIANFGQNPHFEGEEDAGTNTDDNGRGLFKYDVPAGFLSLCSENMPTPAVLDPRQHFDILVWDGNNSPWRSIKGLDFKPDCVSLARLSDSGDNRVHINSVRGPNKYVYLNTNGTEGTRAWSDGWSISSFNEGGFSIGSWNNINLNDKEYCAWCWKGGSPESPTSGSVYFRNETGESIDIADHADFDLGTNDFTIEAFIFPTSQDQFNNIISVGTDSNNGYRMDLSTSNKLRLLAHIGGSWATVITGGTSIVRNFWYHVVITRSGNDFDCWVNGTKDATTVTNSGSITNPSSDGVEIGRLSTNGYNRKYGGYISNLRFVNGTAVYTSNFSIPTSPLTNITNTKLLCCQDSYSATTAAVSPATPTLSNTGVRATAVNAFDAFCVDGTSHMSASAAGITEGSISLGAATVNRKAGFSIIKYKGTGSAGATVGHGLNRTPRIIFFRNQNGEGHDWNVYYNTPNGYGAGVRHLKLNQNSASAYATNKYNSTPATSSVITVHTAADNNQSGQTITAYCWASIPGYSKIGIYRGNGDNDGEYIHTGFRPRWVWCKRVDSSGNWQVWDAARETENEMDQVFEFSDTNSSESSSNTAIDFLAMGFKHRTSFTRSNATGDYLYMAIAETVGMTPYDVMGNAR